MKRTMLHLIGMAFCVAFVLPQLFLVDAQATTYPRAGTVTNKILANGGTVITITDTLSYTATHTSVPFSMDGLTAPSNTTYPISADCAVTQLSGVGVDSVSVYLQGSNYPDLAIWTTIDTVAQALGNLAQITPQGIHTDTLTLNAHKYAYWRLQYVGRSGNIATTIYTTIYLYRKD